MSHWKTSHTDLINGQSRWMETSLCVLSVVSRVSKEFLGVNNHDVVQETVCGHSGLHTFRA